MQKKLFTILLLLLLGTGDGVASWQRVMQVPGGIACGFFLTSQYGFIAEGKYTHRVAFPSIHRTTDGGTSWTLCNTPPVSQGFISSIFLVDSMIGYASITTSDFGVATWKTTDAGVNWHTIVQSPSLSYEPLNDATCIYAVGNNLISCAWDNTGRAGGVSFNDGFTFAEVFFNGSSAVSSNWSNGIDFADTKNGVVVMRPSSSQVARSWITSDGGNTWRNGGFNREAWSVYALKGTKQFFTLPEGYSLNRTRSVVASFDAGVTWQTIFTFSDNTLTFTGNIGGKDNHLYVQTDTIDGAADRGFFRSDDLGLSWKPVGGPSNERDTRFCVTGCFGETVYAFSANGDVWKTSDGGDGSLSSGNETIPALTHTPDTLIFIQDLCRGLTDSTGVITLSNNSCYPFFIDSIYFSDSSSGCQLIRQPVGGLVSASSPDSILIRFTPNFKTDTSATIRIKGLSGSRYVTITIPLRIVRNTRGSSTLSFDNDTVAIRTYYCQTEVLTLPVINNHCDSLTIITSLNSPSESEVSLLSTPTKLLASGETDSIVLQFHSDSEEVRLVPMKLHCTNSLVSFDTIIYVLVAHTRAPDLSIANQFGAKAGEKFSIPVWMAEPIGSVALDSVSFRISYNDDLISPLAVPYSAISTISASAASIATNQPTAGTLECTIRFQPPLTAAADYSRPLIDLLFTTYLTKEFTTAVVLSIIGDIPLTCPTSTAIFILDPNCGDSLISEVLATGMIPVIMEVRPNPASDHIEVRYDASGNEMVLFEIYDAIGTLVKTTYAVGKTHSTLIIPTEGLPNGAYHLRASTGSNSAGSSRRIVIER